MSFLNILWQRSKLPLLVLPALAVTLVSLYALLTAVSANIASTQPGEPLYAWRDSALRVQRALTLGGADRSGLELPETAVSDTPNPQADEPTDLAEGADGGENGRFLPLVAIDRNSRTATNDGSTVGQHDEDDRTDDSRDDNSRSSDDRDDGRDDIDDNSGPSNSNDDDDDNSGPSNSDDDDDDNSGSGNGDDDDDNDDDEDDD